MVGFSLTGDVVQPGTGAILDVVYSADTGGTADVCLNSIVLSDPFGNAMPSDSECGVLVGIIHKRGWGWF